MGGKRGGVNLETPSLSPQRMQISSSQTMTQGERQDRLLEGARGTWCIARGLELAVFIEHLLVQGTAANSGEHTCPPPRATDAVQGLLSFRRTCIKCRMGLLSAPGRCGCLQGTLSLDWVQVTF